MPVLAHDDPTAAVGSEVDARCVADAGQAGGDRRGVGQETRLAVERQFHAGRGGDLAAPRPGAVHHDIGREALAGLQHDARGSRPAAGHLDHARVRPDARAQRGGPLEQGVDQGQGRHPCGLHFQAGGFERVAHAPNRFRNVKERRRNA